MFGRTTARDTMADVGRAVARDETLRRRLGGAVAHGAEAGRRAGNGRSGVTGVVLRLSTDRELQKHLRRAAAELQAARTRLERQRKRSRRRRNLVLVLVAGAGVAAVAFVPPLRRRVTAIAGDGASRDDWQPAPPRPEQPEADTVPPAVAVDRMT